MTYEEKVWDTFIRAMKGDLKAQAEILYVDAMLNGDNRLIKEEKKTLNIDKYREDIRNYPLMNIECYLAELRGGEKCKRAKCEECLKNSLRWLFYEHEPPLLENGDGLKPGDWIMVRGFDHRNWTKMIFIGYFNGCFFTIDEESESCAVGYKQARLPEDGE